MKQCKECGINKDLDDFHKHSAMSDGHLNICKVCKRDYAKVVRNRIKNTDYDSTLEKTCINCGHTGSAINDFYSKPGGKYNRDEKCKKCRLQHNKEYSAPLPESVPSTKICNKCGEEKLLEQFSPALNGYLQRRADCKQCNAARVKKYSSSLENKERRKVHRREKRAELNKEKYIQKRIQLEAELMMTEMECEECHITKPIDNFQFYSKIRENGTKQRRKKCNTCMAGYHKNRNQDRSKLDFDASLTKDCNHCGQNFTIDNFRISAGGKYGRGPYCIECDRTRSLNNTNKRKQAKYKELGQAKCPRCKRYKDEAGFKDSVCWKCWQKVNDEFYDDGGNLIVEKDCKRCGTTIPLKNFRFNLTKADNRDSNCHACYWAMHKELVNGERTKNRTDFRLDPHQKKISKRISRYIYNNLKDRYGKQGASTFGEILPYTIDDLIGWIEALMEPGMSLDKMGQEIHLDHIICICCFDYNSYEDEQFQICWSLKNLQPMWAQENLHKSNNPHYVREIYGKLGILSPYTESITINGVVYQYNPTPIHNLI